MTRHVQIKVWDNSVLSQSDLDKCREDASTFGASCAKIDSIQPFDEKWVRVAILVHDQIQPEMVEYSVTILHGFVAGWMSARGAEIL
jgi:hypothetical protein